MTQHLRYLYITIHINSFPLKRVLLDNEVALNILPYRMLKVLRKTNSDLTPVEISVSIFAGVIKVPKASY